MNQSRATFPGKVSPSLYKYRAFLVLFYYICVHTDNYNGRQLNRIQIRLVCVLKHIIFYSGADSHHPLQKIKSSHQAMLMIKSTQVDFFVAIAKKGCDVVWLIS